RAAAHRTHMRITTTHGTIYIKGYISLCYVFADSYATHLVDILRVFGGFGIGRLVKPRFFFDVCDVGYAYPLRAVVVIITGRDGGFIVSLGCGVIHGHTGYVSC